MSSIHVEETSCNKMILHWSCMTAKFDLSFEKYSRNRCLEEAPRKKSSWLAPMLNVAKEYALCSNSPCCATGIRFADELDAIAMVPPVRGTNGDCSGVAEDLAPVGML